MVALCACKREPQPIAKSDPPAPVASPPPVAPKPTMAQSCRDGELVEEGLGSGMPYSGPGPKDDRGPFHVRAMVDRADTMEFPNALEARLCPAIKEVRACAETARAKSPSLVGTLTLETTVAAGGSVGDVRVRGGTLNDAPVEACAIGALKKIGFASSVDPWTLRYRIVIAAAHGQSPVVKIIESRMDIPGPRRDEVKARVRRNFGEIRDCYELGLRAAPTLHGTFDVDLAIDPSGTAKATLVPKTLTHGPTIACLRSFFDKLTFDAGPALKASYTFDLSYDRP